MGVAPPARANATKPPTAAEGSSHCGARGLGNAGVKGALRRPPAALDPGPVPEDPTKPEESQFFVSRFPYRARMPRLAKVAMLGR